MEVILPVVELSEKQLPPCPSLGREQQGLEFSWRPKYSPSLIMAWSVS